MTVFQNLNQDADFLKLFPEYSSLKSTHFLHRPRDKDENTALFCFSNLDGGNAGRIKLSWRLNNQSPFGEHFENEIIFIVCYFN